MDRSDDLRAITDALTLVAKVQYSRRARRQIEHRAGVPLAPIAIETLGAINSLGPVRHGTVARRLGTQPSRVSKEVRALVDAGYVSETVDPDDRRAVLLEATPLGRDAVAHYVRAAQETLAEVLSQWSDTDVATLAPLLRRLADEFAADPIRRTTR